MKDEQKGTWLESWCKPYSGTISCIPNRILNDDNIRPVIIGKIGRCTMAGMIYAFITQFPNKKSPISAMGTSVVKREAIARGRTHHTSTNNTPMYPMCIPRLQETRLMPPGVAKGWSDLSLAFCEFPPCYCTYIHFIRPSIWRRMTLFVPLFDHRMWERSSFIHFDFWSDTRIVMFFYLDFLHTRAYLHLCLFSLPNDFHIFLNFSISHKMFNTLDIIHI